MLLSGRVAFGLAQLAFFAVLLATSFQPGYRGGRFIVVVLALTLLVQTFALVRDVRIAARRDPVANGSAASAEGTGPAPGGGETAVGALPLTLVALVSAAGLALCYALGFVVGFTVMLFLVWRFVCSFRVLHAAMLAVIVGAVLPLAFTGLLGLTPWRGVVDLGLPWLIGGAIPPPF